MKCTHCGGEVSAQETACPSCGRENTEGIAFQQKVQEKIDRNLLLRLTMKKQKNAELAQRMLTRLCVIFWSINLGLILFFIALYMWMEP